MMNLSQLRHSTRSLARAIVESKRADAPPVEGWPLPGMGCGVRLATQGPELLRDSLRRHGNVFSLQLAGSLVTVCQDERFMRTFYQGTDEDVAPFDACALRLGEGNAIEQRLRKMLLGTEPRNLLRRQLPTRSGEHVAELQDMLRGQLRKLYAALPSEHQLPSSTAQAEGAAHAEALREMAGIGALCLAHICADSTIEQRVRHELATAAKHPGGSDDELLRRAPLLSACLDEALRLYAPVLHLRVARRAITVDGFTLPAGRVLAFSPYLLHRDRRHHSEPDRFVPGRFIAANAYKRPQPRSFIPFGRGRHAQAHHRRLRPLLLATLADMMLGWDLSLSCAGRPTDAAWSLTGMATPSGERWLCFAPRTLRSVCRRPEEVIPATFAPLSSVAA